MLSIESETKASQREGKHLQTRRRRRGKGEGGQSGRLELYVAARGRTNPGKTRRGLSEISKVRHLILHPHHPHLPKSPVSLHSSTLNPPPSQLQRITLPVEINPATPDPLPNAEHRHRIPRLGHDSLRATRDHGQSAVGTACLGAAFFQFGERRWRKRFPYELRDRWTVRSEGG